MHRAAYSPVPKSRSSVRSGKPGQFGGIFMRLVLALLALFIPFSAHAATYHYTGQDIVCPPDSDLDCFETAGFTGSITVPHPVSRLSIIRRQVSSGFETTYDFDASGLKLTGIFHELFYQMVCCDGGLILTFDAQGNVETWNGWAAWGGSNDPSLNTLRDGYATGARSAGPGVWVTTVPIPASGLLLAFALMTGLAARLRRS